MHLFFVTHWIFKDFAAVISVSFLSMCKLVIFKSTFTPDDIKQADTGDT